MGGPPSASSLKKTSDSVVQLARTSPENCVLELIQVHGVWGSCMSTEVNLCLCYIESVKLSVLDVTKSASQLEECTSQKSECDR